jgi:hypothetical protein
VQKKKHGGKNFLLLILTLLLAANICFGQQTSAKTITTTELKQFWKKNEILVGVGSALVFTLVVYALWRKKKRSIINIDSIT